MKRLVKKGTPRKMEPTDNPTFDEWMRRVDRICWNAVGLSVLDLPECAYRDWYDDRVRPVWAAQRAVQLASVEYCDL